MIGLTGIYVRMKLDEPVVTKRKVEFKRRKEVESKLCTEGARLAGL